RLADIDGVALAVEHAVDAGAGRHVLQGGAQHRDAVGDTAGGSSLGGRRGFRFFGGDVDAARAAARIEGFRPWPAPVARSAGRPDRLGRSDYRSVVRAFGHIHRTWG